jgi:hypothetical protein
MDGTSPMPDPRNTLYWDPGINLRDSARIRFYTGDLPGTYIISVHGTDHRGRVIEAERKIEVVEP